MANKITLQCILNFINFLACIIKSIRNDNNENLLYVNFVKSRMDKDLKTQIHDFMQSSWLISSFSNATKYYNQLKFQKETSFNFLLYLLEATVRQFHLRVILQCENQEYDFTSKVLTVPSSKIFRIDMINDNFYLRSFEDELALSSSELSSESEDDLDTSPITRSPDIPHSPTPRLIEKHLPHPPPPMEKRIAYQAPSTTEKQPAIPQQPASTRLPKNAATNAADSISPRITATSPTSNASLSMPRDLDDLGNITSHRDNSCETMMFESTYHLEFMRKALISNVDKILGFQDQIMTLMNKSKEIANYIDVFLMNRHTPCQRKCEFHCSPLANSFMKNKRGRPSNADSSKKAKKKKV